MKYLIITAALFCAMCAVGQTLRKGNTFTRQRKTERDTLVTSKGQNLSDSNKQIYRRMLYLAQVQKRQCYRQYMSKDIKETVCKELKIKSK